MTEILKQFINENLDLIDENSKEIWEQIYKQLSSNMKLTGEFTETLLSANIDPAYVLGYIPAFYLFRRINISEYKIPNNIISIGNRAFFKCINLTYIDIPNTVTSIGFAAFENCSGLRQIVIPDNVTSIGDQAFLQCSSLKDIIIPDSITSIGDFTFQGCKSLKSISIPDTVTRIGKYILEDCINLTEVQYKGTKKQAIKLGIGDESRENWRENSSIQKIICTDGEILL